jgi:hypothetical protein
MWEILFRILECPVALIEQAGNNISDREIGILPTQLSAREE